MRFTLPIVTLIAVAFSPVFAAPFDSSNNNVARGRSGYNRVKRELEPLEARGRSGYNGVETRDLEELVDRGRSGYN
ncbi:hypothetical protein NLI96_g6081 [Meripilus lineatus]|uniref:Uncharacterized protein n=1 Tax=Meripilus lineatus TaxID=2056292 RepID=A0AAD5V3K8_9APHY|nr:hypothetical protein NLI96_g6081 [Physisporinus lineatus]